MAIADRLFREGIVVARRYAHHLGGLGFRHRDRETGRQREGERYLHRRRGLFRERERERERDIERDIKRERQRDRRSSTVCSLPWRSGLGCE